MSDILSQNEIDALLFGVNEGQIATETDTGPSDQLEPYDLTSGISRVEGWIHDIQIVDERIQSNLSISLLGLLHKSVQVKRRDVQIVKFGEYVKTLYVPTSVNTFVLKGMSGHSAIVLDATLVYALVNVFFGGGSRRIQIEGREFTYTEQRVIQLTLSSIVDAIRNGWKSLANVEFNLVETEMNPAAISAFSSTDVLMIRSFKVEFEGGGGEVQILMPGTLIDSIFRNRSRSEAQAMLSNADIIRARALRFGVNVSGELRGASLSIRDLFNLSAGDIIPIDSPEQVDVKVNGVPKFRARMGEVNGKVGLKVLA